MPGHVPGSFRDPDSAVFLAAGEVRRGVSAAALADRQRLAATASFPRLVEEGKVVGTSLVEPADGPDEGAEGPDADAAETAAATPLSPRGTAWAAVEALLAAAFAVHRQETLPGGTRTLYLAEPKP